MPAYLLDAGLPKAAETFDLAGQHLKYVTVGGTPPPPPPVQGTYDFRPSGLSGGGFQNVIAVSPFADSSSRRPWIMGADVAGVHRSVDKGKSWLPTRNVGSHVAAVLWSDQTPGTCWAFCDEGLYRSLDWGVTWSSRSTGVDADANGVYQIGSEHPRPTGNLIAQDNSGATKHLWVGCATQGVRHSVDGGATWQNTAMAGDHIRSIALDPTNPDVLWVAVRNSGANNPAGGKAAGSSDTTRDGLWRCSTARANPMGTFVKQTGFPGSKPEELHFVTNAAGTALLFVAAANEGIFRYNGTTWLTMNTGLPLTSHWLSIYGYLAAGGNVVLYAGNRSPDTRQAIMKSVNAEAGAPTWASITSGGSFTVTVSYNYYLSTPAIVWWGTEIPYQRFAETNYVAAQITLDPENLNNVIAAGRGGCWIGAQTATTVKWAPAMAGLMVTVNNAAACDKNLPGTVAIANMDYKCLVSPDHGQTWHRPLIAAAPASESTGDSIAFDPNTASGPSSLYLCASQRGQPTGVGDVWRNDDPNAGAAWADTLLPVNNDPIAFGVGKTASGSIVLLVSVTQSGLHRKVGAAWDAGPPATGPFQGTSYGMIKFIPGSPTVYAIDNAGVWRSTSAGSAGSWTKILNASAGYGIMDSLVLDPLDAAKIWIVDLVGGRGELIRINNADSAGGLSTNTLNMSPDTIADCGPIVMTASGTLLALDRTGVKLMRCLDPRAAAPVFASVENQFFRDNCGNIRSMAVDPDNYIYTADNGSGCAVGVPI